MQDDGTITVWINQLKSGDDDAAQRLWEKYYNRLIGLARKKLQDAPRGVRDEDDAVQSAFNSFCQRAQAGLFPDLRNRGNLWPLLVLITARKASNQRKHERRAKRGGGQVVNASAKVNDDGEDFAEAIAHDPTPDDAAVFHSELGRFMDSLEDPCHRLILLWKLEERTNEEIARHLDCSLSAVERKLRLIRSLLNSAMKDEDSE